MPLPALKENECLQEAFACAASKEHVIVTSWDRTSLIIIRPITLFKRLNYAPWRILIAFFVSNGTIPLVALGEDDPPE